MGASSILLPLITAAGYFLDKPYWYAPLIVAAMSASYAPVHGWVSSDRLGANAILSASLKLLLSIYGLAATLGFYAAIALAIWWFA